MSQAYRFKKFEMLAFGIVLGKPIFQKYFVGKAIHAALITLQFLALGLGSNTRARVLATARSTNHSLDGDIFTDSSGSNSIPRLTIVALVIGIVDTTESMAAD